MGLKEICQTSLEELRKAIRYYIYQNPKCIKNDIAWELGLYSGYGSTRTNYLSWSLIVLDPFISIKNAITVKQSYIPDEIENLYEFSQLHLKTILTCIINLLSIEPLGNTQISKKLGIETYEINTYGKKCQQNWFCWSCLSILYKFGIIDIFDSNLKLVDPYHKQHKQRMMSFSIKIPDPLNNLIYQDGLNTKKIDSYGIQTLTKILDKMHIEYVKEYKFADCLDKRELPFDIYLLEYKTLLEFDGGQHFFPVFGQKSFVTTQKHDQMKNQYCSTNQIYLLRIAYTEVDKMEFIVKEFLDIIKNNNNDYVINRGKIYEIK